jgi:hypothetical protein
LLSLALLLLQIFNSPVFEVPSKIRITWREVGASYRVHWLLVLFVCWFTGLFYRIKKLNYHKAEMSLWKARDPNECSEPWHYWLNGLS